MSRKKGARARKRDVRDSRDVGLDRRVALLERNRKDSRRERLELARAVDANTSFRRLSGRRQQRYYEQQRYYAPRERHTPRNMRPY